jgi:S-adenosylmethionine:tRNA ribosyltransferase-isomerase
VLGNLIDLLDKNQLDHLSASTQIIIVPGYHFRIVDGLVTNFHQPQSTLLLLISAYLGDEWRTIYDHALANNYRFLSYGDSNLYLRD